MTNDDKKKQLKSYIKASEKIQDLIDEIAHLKEKVHKVTPALSDMPMGTGTSDRAGIIATYMDMINELEIEVKNLQIVKRDVEYLISTIDDWTVERVMRLRYIDGLRWEDICCKVNYTWKWVHKLHSDGLQSIEWND